MKIHGAVLERVGASRPYATSRPLQISSLELDPPGAQELLVRIETAGLCHSDLSVVDGARPRPVPMLLGHEAAGIVEQVGTEVDGIDVGQRVVMTFLPRCGECSACATGGLVPCEPGSAANARGTLLTGEGRLSRGGERVLHHLGVSAFASHAVVDHRSVVPVGADVPAEVAAVMGCAVLTGGGAVLNVGRPRAGQTVIVVGLGGVGMAALLVAAAQDGVEVIGVDPLEQKRSSAIDLGAAAAYSPQDAVAAEIAAPVVIEAAGNVAAFETALALTAAGGRTVTVGLPPPDAMASISPLALVAQAKTVTGSYLGSAVPARDIPKFVDLWRSGRLPVEALFSSTLPLEEINHGMDELAEGRALRQLVHFGDSGPLGSG